MAEPGPRVAAWLDTISELLQHRLTVMPHQTIIDRFAETFACTGTAYNWCSGGPGSQGMLMEPEFLSQMPEANQWLAGEFDGCHPLIAWHDTTQDLRPFTNERVPTGLVSRRLRNRLMEPLSRLELEHQLAVNIQLGPGTYQSYVVGRGGRDFDDEDLLVAGYAQRALLGLNAQIAIVARLTGTSSDPERDPLVTELTGRELAVLQLLAEGLWVRPIARALGCSPRTVEKHLQNLYRKLGVRDRLNAVRVAQLSGLLVPDPTQPVAPGRRLSLAVAEPR